MPDFSKTIIYKICCKDPTITDIYIGHTTDIIRRRYDHKSDCNNEKSKSYHLKQYQFIRENYGWTNWTLIQIEAYPCNNKNEARARERYWIETLKSTLNSYIPNRTKKEYHKDNKEQLSLKKKEYREKNEVIIKKKKKEYRENNKEQLSLKSKEYYKENCEEIKERVKKYAEQNADIIKEYRKEYGIIKKEELNLKQKEYYKEKKEEISLKAKERIKCECGCDVPRRHISEHRKTQKHIMALQIKPDVILE